MNENLLFFIRFKIFKNKRFSLNTIKYYVINMRYTVALKNGNFLSNGDGLNLN